MSLSELLINELVDTQTDAFLDAVPTSTIVASVSAAVASRYRLSPARVRAALGDGAVCARDVKLDAATLASVRAAIKAVADARVRIEALIVRNLIAGGAVAAAAQPGSDASASDSASSSDSSGDEAPTLAPRRKRARRL